MTDVVPGVILFECHIPDTGFWNEESVNVLARLDYQFFAYDLKSYRSTRLYRVATHNMFPAGYDFVALHPSVSGTGLHSETSKHGDRWLTAGRTSIARFSIIITCYNQREFIGPALESALSQRGTKNEIIVVDDGSTDGSCEVLQYLPPSRSR